MNLDKFITFIRMEYGLVPEFLWKNDPKTFVLRHKTNDKWFAVVMNIPKRKLGINEEDRIDILNVKADPDFIGVAAQVKGFYPAYHMNKKHWITVCLDGSIGENEIKGLIADSYQLTR